MELALCMGHRKALIKICLHTLRSVAAVEVPLQGVGIRIEQHLALAHGKEGRVCAIRYCSDGRGCKYGCSTTAKEERVGYRQPVGV